MNLMQYHFNDMGSICLFLNFAKFYLRSCHFGTLEFQICILTLLGVAWCCNKMLLYRWCWVPWFLSSTFPEIDPDTAYVVCISVSLGFPYMVSVFPWFPYGIHICLFSLHGNAEHQDHLDRALLWAAIDAALSQKPLLWRHIDKTVIVSRNKCGREWDIRQHECTVITDWQSIDSL